LLIGAGLGLVVLYAVQWAAARMDRTGGILDLPLPLDLADRSPLPPDVAGVVDIGTLRSPILASARRSEWISVPRIGLDSAIVEVALSGGEWPVPKFVAGHLAESANPGELGNAVFAGHLLSLSSGNVFARLEELTPGDEITFWAEEGSSLFRVVDTRMVRNTDVSVLAVYPGRATVTLITCAGRWIPRDNDYDQRFVVVAEAVHP
jgi:LPXTG-site transpeptidase (sortase) family protein